MILENIPGSICKKAKLNSIDYKKGDTIWTQIYSHEEHRYIRIPWYTVVKTRKTKNGQNIIVKPYNCRDYAENFMK
jgi:hypothetical protein